ncbi:hypothetical protein [Thermochromatium tepidum]|uniref:Uncharacterized protein n=1 Tax=Thermochromatium tepidum TaxID=1050 RepID=C7G4D4_THETI|nr:hypothetical protein [Thermochromatium tepidum]BAH98146.1 hypothetical protein [Thermochromatium tepidum]
MLAYLLDMSRILRSVRTALSRSPIYSAFPLGHSSVDNAPADEWMAEME